MFPATIEEYVRPRSVADALSAAARYDDGEAIFLAGGQSVMQAMKSRMMRPRCVIDLQDLADLKGIDRSNGGLSIGAMTRYVDVVEDETIDGAFAALRDAASRVGDRQVRNRGTIGGSLCWNYMAACTPAVVLALDGQLNLMASDGTKRTLAADDFLLGPLETARGDDEILISVSWPAPAPRSGSAYKKWGQVTDALPGHRVALGDGKDRHGSFGREACHRDMFAGIDVVLIDFVREDPEIMTPGEIGERLQPIAWNDTPGRIRRCRDVEHATSTRDLRLDGGDGLRPRRDTIEEGDFDRRGTKALGDSPNQGPERSEDQNLVARRKRGAREGREPPCRTGRDEDFLGHMRKTVSLAQLLTNSRNEFRQSARVPVGVQAWKISRRNILGPCTHEGVAPGIAYMKWKDRPVASRDSVRKGRVDCTGHRLRLRSEPRRVGHQAEARRRISAA